LSLAFVGLGSNLADRAANIREARERLVHAGVRVTRASNVYETAPRDMLEQPWFLNQVVEVETTRSARSLLDLLLSIEKEMGRWRATLKGPRLIDLDLLIYGEEVIKEPGLEVPHPRISERRFVLEPLAELAPDLQVPSEIKIRRTVRELLEEVRGQAVRRVRREEP